MAERPSSESPDEPGPLPLGELARVERVFFEVSTLAPRDRDEAIRRLCAGEPELEREVRSLVGSAVQLGSYLEQPALGKAFEELRSESQQNEPDDLPGTTLGAYTVRRRIAAGGMGTVYLAERSDGQFSQVVAIKVVKRGMDSEEILRRFRTERETLAALNHPNIARLLDGGLTPDGRPFLVMEYVDGRPIDAYCDERSLGMRERLRLFQEVCAGVQHAHQNLVIHRDLKPSNVLVTPQGVPKLLDFGIAKVLTGSATTGSGSDSGAAVTLETDRRLTPEYASPEQVEGRSLSTASDVYSLGVVLYELLTGVRPYYFGPRTHEEVRRVVCTLAPMPPSEAVTVRASRLRTGSAPAPAGDGGEAAAPVRTDVPRTRGLSSTRLRGMLRGDLDVIVLTALRKEPERRYGSAEQLGADLGRFLQGLPVLARRDTLAYRASKFVRRHAMSVGLTAAAFVFLAATSSLLYRQDVRLRRQSAALVAANQRLDENLKRLGESRRFLQAIIAGGSAGGQGPDARLGDLLRDSLAALRSSPPKDLLTLAAAEEEIGRAMLSLGMLEDARPLLMDAAKQYEGFAKDSDARMDSMLSLGELAFYEGRAAEAEKVFAELLGIERGAGTGTPSARETAILNNLGSALRAQGRTDEAIAMQRRALAATIAVLGEESIETAETRNNLASALFQKGSFDEAAVEFGRACDLRSKLLRPDHPLVVRCLSNLGLAKLRIGEVDAAVGLLTRAAEGWDRAFGSEHPGRIPAMTSLGQALRKQGHPADAEVWLRRALEWQRAHQPGAAEAIAATEANIGLALAEEGKDAEAIETLERAIPVLRSGGRSPGILRSAIEMLAVLYERGGQADKAASLRAQIAPDGPRR